MKAKNEREMPEENAQKVAEGTCPRCGEDVQKKPIGRPPIWCSQICRRAAYEERRAAAEGAIAVEVIERVETRGHSIGTCVDRTIGTPTGCRRVVYELARLARDGTLARDPKWGTTYTAVHALIDAVLIPHGKFR